MVIGPDFVFIAIPRTASVSISRHWLPHYGGVSLNEHDYHRADVPAEHAHKFTFAVVRDPYERMLSMWRFLRTFTPGSFPEELRLENPEDLVRFCMNGPEGFQWWSQARMLAASRIDRVLRFEALEDGLRSLPFVEKWHPLPHANEAPGERVYTQGFVDLVNKFERETFEQHGYSMRTCATVIV